MTKVLISIAAVASGVIALAPVAAADVGAPPPYINNVQWVSYGGLPTLRVYPTAAGREVAGDVGKTVVQADEAWAEVVGLAPDADTLSIRAQFICHWQFAELAEPGKTSWNLEAWRPDVDDNTMVLTGCNPGGSEKGK